MARSFKRVLFTILGTCSLTDELLQTTFCLVEQALNSRPLTPVGADPSNLKAITRCHYILVEYSTCMPSNVDNKDFDHRKSYARAQSYVEVIYPKWTREYVPTLDRCSKCHLPVVQYLKTGYFGWVVDGILGVSDLQLGLLNSVMAPTASRAPPACTTCSSFPNISMRAGGCYE